MTKDKENTMPTQKKKTTTGRGLGMSGCTSTHQTIIRDILRNFQKLFPKYAQNIQTDINVIDRPGTKGRRFPDISLWQYAHRSGNDVEPVGLLMTIEITHTSGNDEASKKTIEMTFRHCPSLVEAFLYNYKKKVWIRYWRVGNTIKRKEADDNSQVLKMNLSRLLESDEWAFFPYQG